MSPDALMDENTCACDLPDLSNLKMTAQPSESMLMENVFLAGDILFNGSLNAAMESGLLAAHGLMERKLGMFK